MVIWSKSIIKGAYTVRSIKLFIKSTRFKTTLWYALVFLALEVVIGALIYIYLQRSLYKELDLALAAQTELVYHYVNENSASLLDFQPDSIYLSSEDFIYDIAFEAIALNPNNSFLQVSMNDRVIFQTENLKSKGVTLERTRKPEKFVNNYDDVRLSDYRVRAAVLNKDNYQIISAFPTDHISNTLNSLLEIYLSIAPVFFCISLAGGAFISYKSFARIDSLIGKTRYITAQNLDERIEGEEFNDEYGRLIKTLNEMISRIKKSIDYMNQFSISAAHELKTPLTILRGEIELALRSELTPSEYREVLRSNLDETIRLTNIVDKLFFISRTDHKLIKLNKQTTDLKSLISSVIDSLKKLAQEKNIKLNLAPCENVFADVDPHLLGQVFSNLLDNAIKYGDKDSEVTIQIQLRDSRILISLKNLGEYIPPELHQKIFERFFRIESSRNRDTGGTGLGLSVAKAITELHQGEIEVESDPSGYTIFKVSLPTGITA